jgi:predicted phage tail protein
MHTTAFRRLILSAAFGAVLIGCASPGEPVERKAPVPQPVTDLTASQSGDDVVLTFTVPKQGVNRLALKQPPSLEIYRGIERPATPSPGQAAPGAASAPENLALLATIPSTMVSRYAQHGQVHYADSLTPSDFQVLANQKVDYVVRAFVVAAKSSANSNPAAVEIIAPPTPIEDLSAEVTHAGIALKWTAPTTDMSGQTATLLGYRIYRREISAGTRAATSVEPGNVAQAQFARIAEAEPGAAAYLDGEAAAGETYAYAVRSVIDHSGQNVESADSNVVTVVDRDVFPPAAPQNLVVAPVPAQGNIPAHVELSWQISPETDVGGYNVYRSDTASARGERQNTEQLPTPAFRDMNVAPGRRYFYSVTAIDRSGNESAPSVPVPADVPGSNP